MAEIFDFFAEWPEKYDMWFETPMGRLVREYESRLLLGVARPGQGEKILDVGCGTGVFTADLLAAGSRVTGLELSLPMLRRAGKKASVLPFHAVKGHPIFAHARFRSPSEMKSLAPLPTSIRTVVHFHKHDDPSRAVDIERDGDARGLDTGAFLVACWEKPAV